MRVTVLGSAGYDGELLVANHGTTVAIEDGRARRISG
jgi:hypothetical protein